MARQRRGRGEGGIFQRADGRWVGTFSQGYAADGKRKRTTVYGASKKEVQDKLAEIRSAPDAPQEVKQLTVKTYLAKWLEVVRPSVEFGTFRPYRSHVDLHLVPYLGRLRLVELKRFHIEELYGSLARAGVSAAMQRKIGTTLTIALGAAVDKELIAFNPASRVRKPKASKPEIRPLNGDQVAAFLEAARQDRLFAFYVLALDSGMRPGEIFALEWPDIDFDRSTVTVTKSLAVDESGQQRTKDAKTKRARRQIRLSAFTLDCLHDHRKRMVAEGWTTRPVFCNTAGSYVFLTDLSANSFKPTVKRAGLPDFRLYDLRHTCATMLLQAGENVKVVSERLGHATIVLTLDTYAHVLDGMQEQAAAKMDGILRKAAGL